MAEQAQLDPGTTEEFFGGIVRKLDDKNRIVLPAGKLRDAFAEGAKLTPWADCLALWTSRSYRYVSGSLRQNVRDGVLDPGVIEDFREDTVEVKADTQGRLQIPFQLLLDVGIEPVQGSEVLLSGQDDHVQLWDPARRAVRRGERPPDAARTAFERLRRI